MPFFDFSSPIVKKKTTVKPKIKRSWTVLEKNVKGVVDINEDLLYVAITDNDKHILIHKDCYKCKAHKVIYSRILWGEHKERLIIHRVDNLCGNNTPYLPFAVGCIVIGDIICATDTMRSYFNIKKCYVDNTDTLAYSITKAFQQIFDDELKQRIISHNIIFEDESI